MQSSFQKTVMLCLVFAVVLAGAAAFSGNAKNVSEEQQINGVIKQFINSIRERDINSIQNIIDNSITIIEASNSNSNIETFDSNKLNAILAPSGNDDWEKTTVSDISVAISKTHPSVAMVSFTIKFPLGEKELKSLQAIPAEVMKSMDEEQRKNMEQIIRDKSINASMFALLAKRQGNWKIVCITFPK